MRHLRRAGLAAALALLASAARAQQPQAVPPDVAFARGWMPLRSTGVDAFRQAYPAADGRGVLIGILDSGIDPGIPGLQVTTTGSPKILDLRDFSGEGRVVLAPVTPRGDSVAVGDARLGGFGRVAGFNPKGPWYGGTLAEIPLGELPAADLDGDGDDTDVLAVVVTRASDGWVLFADTDGDGSLANEKPVHDYLVARESFGWSVPGKESPLNIVVNFAEGPRKGDPPVLDLLFDTSAHGSHVAGIAAAHDMYGVAGFDGVAPGAQLIGLKISNNALGGITTTGSMLRALDYVIGFAAARKLPLVLNMSFGVGNEREGTARIDQLIDSVLARHPEIPFTVSAGNDGPGLSTVGFPGSADRIISVGATYAPAFLPGASDGGTDVLAEFSSRGGPLGRPDLVAPGLAYSTVPRWRAGEEQMGGTSMASPHAAGLAALLVSAAVQRGVPYDGRRIRQALMVTAAPLAGTTRLDDGAGLANVGRAWQWLEQGKAVPDLRVRALGCSPCASGAFRERGLAGGDTTQVFQLLPGPGVSLPLTFRSDAPWLVPPAPVTVNGAPVEVRVHYQGAALRAPGLHLGTVTAWGPDTLVGPVARLVNAVVVPHPAGTNVFAPTEQLQPGQSRRVFFVADSGRPFQVAVATGSRFQGATASLHEPGGQPFRDEGSRPAGFGPDAALYEVDGDDAVAGVYEAVATAPPSAPSSASVRVVHAPVRLAAARGDSGVTVTVAGLAADSVPGVVAVLLVGAERSVTVQGKGSAPHRIGFVAPPWATQVVVDLSMDRAQWSRFTDFGAALVDSAGRIVAKEPANYAFVRLQWALPKGHGDVPLTFGLFPGFAEPASAESWEAQVSIRLYADAGTPLPSAGGELRQPVVVPAGGTARVTVPWADPPGPLGDGFFPLGLTVFEQGRNLWTREAGLPPARPPLMR